MKTLQEQYNAICEGKGQKDVFLKEAKKQFPNMVTNAATLEETVKILTNRSVISENLGGYVDLKPVTKMEGRTKESYELAYEKFLAEEAKVEEKKATKEVEEAETANFDYKNEKNLDNQIGSEVQKGVYFEAKQDPDASIEELKERVLKNLQKDQLYYKKNAMFGVEGLGLEEMSSNEVSGKHKESGYSDKLKALVKESLGAVISNVPVFEQNLTEIESDIVAYIADVYIQNSRGGDKRFAGFRDLNIRDAAQDVAGILRDPQHPLHQETKEEYEIVKADKTKGLFEAAEEEDAPKSSPTKAKKMKKESIDTQLAEIGKEAEAVKLEAQLNFLHDHIAEKQARVDSINEDENLSELVDKSKLKEMNKTIKELGKRAAKMEKIYEKSCGKAYSRQEEIVGEEEAPSFE